MLSQMARFHLLLWLNSIPLYIYTTSFFVCLFLFLNFIYLFIYFLAALGLHCCTQAFCSCSQSGLLFVVVCGLLIAVASLVAGLQAHGLQQLWHASSVVVARRLSSCGAWAQLLHSMWDLPRPGIESVSPALAGGFLILFFLISFYWRVVD